MTASRNETDTRAAERRSLERIGVVNRGEAAVRFLATVRAMRRGEQGPRGIWLATRLDRGSLAEQQADEVVVIGEGRAAYLDAANVVAALRRARCDAAWLGWGFAAEDADFAETVERAGITLIGPTPEQIRRLGDKIAAKRLAEELGIAVVPWAIVGDHQVAAAAADRVGYPLLIKAAGGGGGRGIRLVEQPAELQAALASALAEARRSFGGSGVLLEALVRRARHVEVQVIGDGRGRVLTLGVRDCTLQRRRQKLFEETPSPALAPEKAAELCDAAQRLCEAVCYRSAGTVEFIFDVERDAAYMMEVNARLQVEHPVSELVFGIDLVRWQLEVAAGGGLPQHAPQPRGWAIEARVYAEDPAADFAPTPGRLARFQPACGPGLRVDTGFVEGDVIAPEFDALVAKVIALGETRDEALARLARGLEQTRIVVEGGMTNLPFLRAVVADAELCGADACTSSIDEMSPPFRPGADIARLAAAVDAYLEREPVVGPLQLELGESITVYRVAEARYSIRAGERGYDLERHPVDRLLAWFDLDGRRHRVERVPQDAIYLVDGVPQRVSRAVPGQLLAPCPALVLSVAVGEGDRVVAGQRLALLESMKMEIPVVAACDGVIIQLRVGAGDQVKPGQLLLSVELEGAGGGEERRVEWPLIPPRADDPGPRLLAALVGWDVEPAQFEADLAAIAPRMSPELLEVFADVAALFDRRPRGSLASVEGASLSPASSILDAVATRSLQVLEPTDRQLLERVLRYHGADGETALGGALLERIRRAGAELKRSARVARAALARGSELGLDVLERLSSLDPSRFPQICEAADRLRYEHYERPALSAAIDESTPASAAGLCLDEVHGLELCLDELRSFELRELEGGGTTRVFLGRASAAPNDVRLLAYTLVRSIAPAAGDPERLPELERAYFDSIRALQIAREEHDPQRRLHWNRLTIVVVPIIELSGEQARAISLRLAPAARRLGLERVVVRARFAAATTPGGEARWMDWSIANPSGHGLAFGMQPTTHDALQSPTEYETRRAAARRQRLVYPYDLIAMLTTGGDLPGGRFEEWDLGPDGAPVRVTGRPAGRNSCGVVFGVIGTRHDGTLSGPRGGVSQAAPELRRVLLLSDPTRRMGALAEAECRRVIAAIDIAEALDLPLEWVPVSSGALIDWQTGTENLDWTARVLRRIIEFTQSGGEINIIVDGICVGAQAYWNAEATMMMHCAGLSIMTERGAMVLTGKQALDFSGCVSAEDNFGIGGYGRIMGPNGQAQLYARDLGEAYRLLWRYYRTTRGRRATCDPAERDICLHPYPAETGHGFSTVGEIFSQQHNGERKRPFAIRPVMEAVADSDADRLERWSAWRDAETAVVWETSLGGHPVTLVGIESQRVARSGATPSDGPDAFAGGTLFPQSARKMARALNAASGRRPVVVLANLSGFDGSPESMRLWQLEYGAELGRAVTNFRGSILFVVVSRYHGGAYVVFSRALNPGLRALALEGSYASVIGGAPAAAVVFRRDVERLARERGGTAVARAEATAELAARFDNIHTVERARRVGSIDEVIEARALRPRLIALLGGAASGAEATAEAADDARGGRG